MENNNGTADGTTPIIHINNNLVGSVEFNVKKELSREELKEKIEKELASLLREADKSAE